MNNKAQFPKGAMKSPHYRSYLLRLWREEGLQGSDWRASLEVPETGLRLGFTNLEQLFGYLMDNCESLRGEPNVEGG